MEAHEYYKKETGKLYYKEAALELELTDDYINWLERNVVKLFTVPAVSGQSEQLNAKEQDAFDKGYTKGWTEGFNSGKVNGD